MIVPWTMYQCYGDTRILEQQYDSMVEWVDFMRDAGGDDFIWDGGFHFGDWLASRGNGPSYPGATTEQGPDRHRFLRVFDRPVARTAAGARQRRDAAEYARVAQKIKAASGASL